MQIPVQLSFDLPQSQPESFNEFVVPIDQIFPEAAANELAALESFNKHLYRPNTYLHKWWARRSGTTFRYILKQLVGSSAKRDYYEPGGLEGTIILDPMMGGGTTIHEAIRMGANIIGVDIDPIPVLQAKASLNWIPIGQRIKTFGAFFSALRDSLFPLYRTNCPTCREASEIQFSLYGLRRRCKCGEVLCVDSLILRETNDGLHVKLCNICGEVYNSLQNHCNGSSTKMKILTKGESKCELCRSPFQDIIEEPFPQRYTPIAIVGACPVHGQFFKRPDKDDQEVLDHAREISQNLDFGNHRACEIPSGPKSDDLLRRNICSFMELFTPRQLLYLNRVIRLLLDFPHNDRLWLSLLVSTSLEFNSLLCGYKGVDRRRPGAIRHVFSHHAYSFPYTALENNPIFKDKTSGTLQRLFSDRIVRASKWAMVPVERRLVNDKAVKMKIHGEVDGGHSVASFDELIGGIRRFFILQSDSRNLSLPDECVDYVITDPPYYDSVQYSDLSNFFRVWLSLFLPHEADWSYDQYASAAYEGGRSKAGKYAQVLGQIWKESARVLKKENGRLIFTFHHWKPDAWAELAISLRRAGFKLINRYVVFSENPVSVHILNLKALIHDTILVLKPHASNGKVPKWSTPTQIDTMDSYGFCRDCGGALGWFLNSDLSEEQIYSAWDNLLRGEDNGKASS